MEDRLKQLFETAVNTQKLPGVAAIALNASGKPLFRGAFGSTKLDDPNAPKMTTSTRTMIHSCTKLATCVAALQLVEQGKLDPQDRVDKYVPEIKELKVLEGFEADGTPNLREAKSIATILMLMTHTAGLSYDTFNPTAFQWRVHTNTEPCQYSVSEKPYYLTPLVHDPGSKWEYGTNIDFLGWVIETITGTTLEAYLDEHIFQPLGMKDTGPAFADGDEILYPHLRGSDGTLTATTIVPPRTLYPRGGGHFLVSTIDDYSLFLLTILNGGTLPNSNTRILKQSTVTDYLFTDFIPKLCPPTGIGDITIGMPALTNAGTFMPDVKKGWSCGMLLNLETREKGRTAGSGAWAGLGNQYYWIDPVKGVCGMVISQLFPFMDKEVLHLFDALEREVYGKEVAKVMGEKGSNFRLKE